ncbi:MAG TPA: class I SAM-dependent RNA methyltransferase [Anaeromyxobacter sp.]
MRVELEIYDLAPGGEGVARHGSRAVFVPFTAPGDRVLADLPAGEGTAHGELIEVLAHGPLRVEPPCRHFGRGENRECGGCEWLHVSYEAQAAAKTRTVVEALRRIGRLEAGSYELREIILSPSALRYRSRAKFHLDAGSGRLAFFRRRSHAPVPLLECHLLLSALDDLREAMGPALASARLAPREVALEWSEHEARGSALLLLEPTAAARERAAKLVAGLPALRGAVLRGEGGATAVVGAPVLRHARVPGRAEAGLQRSRPDVFQQANRGANALLVAAAVELAAPGGEDVLELHCGAGNFTAPLAARARSVSAVEEMGPALDLAREDLRGAANVRFFAGDALKLAASLAAEGRRFGAVLLDPPREGAKGVGRVLRALGSPRAVYVSCDPATLARDVRGCVEQGYRVRTVQPVDMFPQTHHVEAVVALEKAG